MNRKVAQRVLSHQRKSNTQDSANVNLSFLTRSESIFSQKFLVLFPHPLMNIEHLHSNSCAYNEH